MKKLTIIKKSGREFEFRFYDKNGVREDTSDILTDIPPKLNIARRVEEDALHLLEGRWLDETVGENSFRYCGFSIEQDYFSTRDPGIYVANVEIQTTDNQTHFSELFYIELVEPARNRSN